MNLNFDPGTYLGLDKLGRLALSKSFHMREFLSSEIAVHHKLRNVPERDRLEFAVFAGRNLCEKLLEPLQDTFGRLHIRSDYRSREVNAVGVGKHGCAADNDGFHTWDYPSKSNGRGADACISTPGFADEVSFNIGWHERPMKLMSTWRGGGRDLRQQMPIGDKRKVLLQDLLATCATSSRGTAAMPKIESNFVANRGEQNVGANNV